MRGTPPSFPASTSRVCLNESASLTDAPYVIATFHTPDYRAKADRLLASCVDHGLAIALYETPAVHRSLSANGSDDLSLTKPSFLLSALQTFERPVLYVDADVVFHERPLSIDALVARGVDFAVYNWLADTWNDIWHVEPIQIAEGVVDHSRYWGFNFAIDFYDPTQLMCSGMAQLWRPSQESLALLTDWQATIDAHVGAPDDVCLDYVFNTRDNARLRCEWLDKSYARMPGWPHVRPIIAHPDPVNPSPSETVQANLKERIDFSRASLRPSRPPEALPRDAILDTQEGMLLRIENNRLVRLGRPPLWF